MLAIVQMIACSAFSHATSSVVNELRYKLSLKVCYSNNIIVCFNFITDNGRCVDSEKLV